MEKYLATFRFQSRRASLKRMIVCNGKISNIYPELEKLLVEIENKINRPHINFYNFWIATYSFKNISINAISFNNPPFFRVKKIDIYEDDNSVPSRKNPLTGKYEGVFNPSLGRMEVSYSVYTTKKIFDQPQNFTLKIQKKGVQNA